MHNNKLEISITKDSQQVDIDLNSLSIHATNVFLEIVEALKNIARLTPDSDNIRIQITKGSAKTAMVNIDDAQVNVIERTLEDVVNGNCEDKDIVENWRTIQNIFQANGLQYEAKFLKGSTTVPIYSKITSARKFRARPIKREYEYKLAFLTGKLIAVGGKNPNLHILNDNDETIIISCDESSAIEANKYLYQNIRISCWQKKMNEEKSSYEFCGVYNSENRFNTLKNFIEELNSTSDEISYLTIIHRKYKALLNEQNFSLARSIAQLFIHKSTPLSTLKTILVITKAFKNHPEFKDSREAILQAMEENS